jgi:hypothetical protein
MAGSSSWWLRPRCAPEVAAYIGMVTYSATAGRPRYDCRHT